MGAKQQRKRRNSMEIIPCVVLAYCNFDLIKETIDYLTTTRKFKIYVIENWSDSTEKVIKPFLLSLLESGSIYKYVLMHQNVSNNAYEQFFDKEMFDHFDAPYILITDGDIVPESMNEEWLEEQITILTNHKDVGSCGINLSAKNLPSNVSYFANNKDEAYNCSNWVPDVYGKHFEDYVEAGTGLHFWLSPMDNFKSFLQWRKKGSHRFIDHNIKWYYNQVLHKRWVITKRNYGIHLTWTIYQDEHHPYTQMKINKSFAETWQHHNYTFFTEYTRSGKRYYYPAKALKAAIRVKFPVIHAFAKKLTSRLCV